MEITLMKTTFTDFRSRKLVEGWSAPNDGTRTLLESTMVPELVRVMQDLQRAKLEHAVLIGGAAFSYWHIPRMTSDIDLLFISADLIPDEIPGFKRTRAHAFRHNATHVDVEVLDAGFLKMPVELAAKIYQDSVVLDGIRVASKTGLVAAKLLRFSLQDRSDICHLINLGGVDLSSYPVTEEMRVRFNQSVIDAVEERNNRLGN